MKALSMPINAVVIIALAAIVLLVIGGFFLSGTSPSMNKIKAREIFENRCPKYACTLDTASKNQFDKEFIDACHTLYGVESADSNSVPVECLWYCECGIEADKCALNCDICHLNGGVDKDCCTLIQVKSPECIHDGKCTNSKGEDVSCPTNAEG